MTAYELIRQLIKLPPDSNIGVTLSAEDRRQIVALTDGEVPNLGDIWLLTESFIASPSANKQVLCGTITVSS